MAVAQATSKGELIATALTGAWRTCPPALALTADELGQITPLLYSTGAGALVWRRLRSTTLRVLPAAIELQQAYRLQTLRAARSERDIQSVFRLLRAEGIEPLLFKGWAAARLYPEEGLRPWGDIDLYVRPRDYARAQTLVQAHARALTSMIDLYHKDFADLDERGVEELYARSQVVSLGDAQVRVPGEADHLRLLCLHWLRHHAWRPLWLSDIAAALENRSADFAWAVVLRGTRRQREWIACALALAHQLLGADISATPIEMIARALPHWLGRTVLKQWCFPIRYHEPDNLPLLTFLRQRTGLLKALSDRWPNAIEATYERRGPFTRLPRTPYQLGLYLARALRFQARLPQLLRRAS
jgi:Uncharacterised nucleotidyltransferase